MIKRKILILCSGYLDSTSANGVCTRNLAEYIAREGHSVWVIAVTQDRLLEPKIVNGVYVYGIPNAQNVQSIENAVKLASSWGRFKLALYRAFWGMLSLYCYPKAVLKTRVKSVYELSVSLIDAQNMDVVLGTSFPYDSIEVAEMLKSRYGHSIHVVTYHYDLLFYPNNTNPIVYKVKRNLFLKAFKKECSIVDRILLPETCEEVISNENVEKVGFPVYCDSCDSAVSNISFDPNYINISYVGSLDRTNRNPIPVIQCLDKIRTQRDFPLLLHIWGGVRGDEILKSLEEYEFVKYYGSIDNKFVQDIYSKSDYLLNISNKTLYNLLPSKIFQFFYSGKPIINFVQNINDVSLPYFKNYKYSINILPVNNDWENELCNFLMAAHEPNQINPAFERFSPSFISKFIVES